MPGRFKEPAFCAVFYQDDSYRLALTPGGRGYQVQRIAPFGWVQIAFGDTAEKLRFYLQRKQISPFHPIFGVVAQLPLFPSTWGWSVDHAHGVREYSAATLLVPWVEALSDAAAVA